MKSRIFRLLMVAVLAALVPGVVAADSSELYLKRFSLFGSIGGGGGSQTFTVEHVFGADESVDLSVMGANGGVGFAYNNLFTPNLRIGFGVEGVYLNGSDSDITLETTIIMPRLMISYIAQTSVGGIEPGLFVGLFGLASVCESGDNIEDDCDGGAGGEVGGSIYWTPVNLRWLSIGADFRYVGADNLFGSSVDSYLGMLNARFQYNFGG